MENHSGESYFYGNVVAISLLEIIWQNTPRGTRSVHDGVKYHQYMKSKKSVDKRINIKMVWHFGDILLKEIKTIMTGNCIFMAIW